MIYSVFKLQTNIRNVAVSNLREHFLHFHYFPSVNMTLEKTTFANIVPTTDLWFVWSGLFTYNIV